MGWYPNWASYVQATDAHLPGGDVCSTQQFLYAVYAGFFKEAHEDFKLNGPAVWANYILAKADLLAKYGPQVPDPILAWPKLVGGILNYLEAEKKEPGEHKGVTTAEFFEAVGEKGEDFTGIIREAFGDNFGRLWANECQGLKLLAINMGEKLGAGESAPRPDSGVLDGGWSWTKPE